MSYVKQSKYSKKKYCPVKCSTDVGVDLDISPKVSCKELWRRGTDFDIELGLEVNPRCRLVPVKQIKDDCDPCKTTCIFKVELDFDCKPKVIHRLCSKPQAEVQLDVELLVEPRCRPLEECKIRYYKDDDHKKAEESCAESCSESEADADVDCDCEVCEPEKKYNREKRNFWL
jgi:hypothetical protein